MSIHELLPIGSYRIGVTPLFGCRILAAHVRSVKPPPRGGAKEPFIGLYLLQDTSKNKLWIVGKFALWMGRTHRSRAVNSIPRRPSRATLSAVRWVQRSELWLLGGEQGHVAHGVVV
jgi:hypothetical protein